MPGVGTEEKQKIVQIFFLPNLGMAKKIFYPTPVYFLKYKSTMW
jgi:hypothetical protein